MYKVYCIRTIEDNLTVVYTYSQYLEVKKMLIDNGTEFVEWTELI